jgi:hypothetical protein
MLLAGTIRRQPEGEPSGLRDYFALPVAYLDWVCHHLLWRNWALLGRRSWPDGV